MGVSEFVSALLDSRRHKRKLKKHRQLQVCMYVCIYMEIIYINLYKIYLIDLRTKQTVEIKIKMDCEGCERKVKKSVDGMKGENGF